MNREPIFFRIVLGLIGAFWIATIILIVAVGYQFVTMTPEDVGSFFGKIVSGFHSETKP